MICKPCGIAGDITKFIKETDEFVSNIGEVALLIEAAKVLHQECPGSPENCDCMHRRTRINLKSKTVKM